MNTPNYSALLQSFWTPPRTPITENSNSNNHPTEPTGVPEFRGEELVWQQTIPATRNPSFGFAKVEQLHHLDK